MTEKRRGWVILVCVLLALICYYRPWYTHKTAGFTMHAFDLAEFASLHPAVRSSSPPMLASFLLRVPQVALAAAFVLLANGWRDPRLRWVLRGVALTLALRFLPPSDFFSSASGDPNYRQMALLTGLGLVTIAVSGLLVRAPVRWQRRSQAVVLAAGAAAGWMGISRTNTLMDNFEIDVALGYGIIGFTVASAVAVAAALWPASGQKRFRSRTASAAPAMPVQE